MLKNSFTPRLLKKVRMQGGAPGTHPQDGCRCEAYLRVRRSAARARQRGRWAFFSGLLGRIAPDVVAQVQEALKQALLLP